MARDQARVARRNQDAEIVVPDEIGEHLLARLGEMGGYIDHEITRSSVG
jgi:hypothetical protein